MTSEKQKLKTDEVDPAAIKNVLSGKTKKKLIGFDPVVKEEEITEAEVVDFSVGNFSPEAVEVFAGVLAKNQKSVSDDVERITEESAREMMEVRERFRADTINLDEVGKAEAARKERDASYVYSSAIRGEPRISVDGERWFTYQQLARILMCSHASLFGYVRKGKVETKKIDGITLYRLNGYM